MARRQLELSVRGHFGGGCEQRGVNAAPSALRAVVSRLVAVGLAEPVTAWRVAMALVYRGGGILQTPRAAGWRLAACWEYYGLALITTAPAASLRGCGCTVWQWGVTGVPCGCSTRYCGCACYSAR